jgi:hypothetical protein
MFGSLLHPCLQLALIVFMALHGCLEEKGLASCESKPTAHRWAS